MPGQVMCLLTAWKNHPEVRSQRTELRPSSAKFQAETVAKRDVYKLRCDWETEENATRIQF